MPSYNRPQACYNESFRYWAPGALGPKGPAPGADLIIPGCSAAAANRIIKFHSYRIGPAALSGYNESFAQSISDNR